MTYVRIFKRASGAIIVNMPAEKYQLLYAATGEDSCPIPANLNPNEEGFEARIMPMEEFRTLHTECEQNETTLYFDENNELKSDIGWNNVLMFPHFILSKRLKRLSNWISTELSLETPDIVKVLRWKEEKERLSNSSQLTALELYQIALDSLQYAPSPKPLIQQKLEAKILELQATPDLPAFSVTPPNPSNENIS